MISLKFLCLKGCFYKKSLDSVWTAVPVRLAHKLPLTMLSAFFSFKQMCCWRFPMPVLPGEPALGSRVQPQL